MGDVQHMVHVALSIASGHASSSHKLVQYVHDAHMIDEFFVYGSHIQVAYGREDWGGGAAGTGLLAWMLHGGGAVRQSGAATADGAHGRPKAAAAGAAPSSNAGGSRR